MNKKQTRKEMQRLLDSGVRKDEIFQRFKEGDIKEKKVAHWVATLKDQALCLQYDRLNNILITLMLVFSGFAVLNAFLMGSALGGNVPFWLAGSVSAVALLFVWGFYKYSLATYNVYIILSITQLPQALQGFSEAPLMTTASLVISSAMIAYVWYIKSKLYPGVNFYQVRQSKAGEYQFS